MKKLQLVGIAVIMAESALAGNISWNGGAGDTDLSKPTNWGVGTLTGADNATIGVNNQTFTLDKNTSFSTMVLNSKVTAAAFDFSANPTNEIYLGTTSGDAFKATGSSNMTLSFKGGVWRGTGDTSFRAASDAYNNNSTTVFDGTIVTNFGTYTWGDHSKGSQRTELKNGAQAYVKHAYHYAAGSNAVLMVSGGSRLVATSYLRTAYQGSASAGTGYHKIIIEGEGTFVQAGDKGTSQSGLRIGDTYDHCSVIVSNRATLVAKGLVLSTHDNNLWASNAILKLSNYLYFSGVSNRVDMLDCDLTIGALTMNGSYGRCLIRGNRGSISLPVFSIDASTYGSRNEIEVWDAVTSTQGSFGSAPLGRGNVYRLMRTATVKSYVKNFAGSNHEINICGEGTTGGNIRYESGTAVTFGGGQTNCWLRLMDGVGYEVPNASYLFGYAKAEGHDNTIYVGTNATMSLLRFRTGNYGNRVVIDNGTFTTPEFYFDYANLTERAVSNSVVFAGTHPKFLYTLNATYSLPTTGGWYVFEVPPEGYEAAPLQVSKGLKIPDGAQVVVHADVEKLSRHFNGRGGLVPLMTGTSVTVSDNKLAAMTQALGQPGANFVVKDNVLYLRVHARGLILLLF